jgi:hypothetical protein
VAVMKFNSKSLQQSFEQAKPILDGLKPMDPVSEDIHELERFLKTLHLKESFIFNLNFTNTPAYQEELLIWDNKSQRLIYTKNIYKVTCLSHEKGYYQHINYDDKETLIDTPLIDAPTEIKKQITEEDKLALFLSLLTQKFNETQPSLRYFN